MSPQLIETLAATYWFWIFSTGFITSIVTSIYVLLFTSYWWVILLYGGWIWYDRKISEKGGRPIQIIRQWNWWNYMKNYFKFKLVAENEFNLDPNKNYLFACFPHGILPVGPFASFVNGYESVFPNHKPFLTVLNIQFWMPIIRELFLSVGAVSVSGPSIKHLLTEQKGGNLVSILIGGAEESKFSKPGKYKIILKKRKGFVKLALQTGSPLVPVITFGETDVFDQLDFPGFNAVRNFIQHVTQVGIVVPIGTHFVCPNRVQVTTVVGKPLKVIRKENPSTEEIVELHEKFMDSIVKLFENHKHKYLREPNNTFLEIV